jgi:hypothetical protein
MENNYPMIIAAAVLFFFLLYKEIRRVNKDRLFFRILAVLAATIALVFMIIPLTYKVSRSSNANELRLLSEGADPKLLKEGNYFTTDSSVLVNSGLKNVKYIPDLAYYLQAHQDINRISAYGYGLKPGELKYLKDYTYDFHPAAPPGGIVYASWPHALKRTALLEVQGSYNNITDRPVKLILEGLGSGLDSVTVNAGQLKEFYLKSRPKQLGKALYALTAVQGKDTVEKEKIPFQVEESAKVRLLVLSSFPDFEYKFLKNWLFENKYPVVFRTRISKDKFSQDQLNTVAVNAENINTGMLGKFDMVIADDDELSKLNADAVNSLQAAVNQGLGLLIRLGDIKPLSGLARQFKLYAPADSGAKSITPVLMGIEAGLQPIPAGQAFYIRPEPGEQVLVKDRGTKVLLSANIYGNGKIAGSAITSTYQWILTGAQGDYAKFWSDVISKTARKEAQPVNWRTVPAFPAAGGQAALIYETNSSGTIPLIAVNQQKISPLQHIIFPFSWEAVFWPQQTGWNTVKTENNPAGYFFVFGNQDWKGLNQQQLLTENIFYAKNKAEKVKTALTGVETLEKQVSEWWFFALFLLAAGYIWFETKLL